MGRELRRVPANWQHPQEDRPNYRTGQMEPRYQAMHDSSYLGALNEWIEEHRQWESGEHPSQIKYGYRREKYPHFAHYGGNPPSVECYRPDWKPEEMTWWQVYETVSEGTPVTPPFETQAELVEYLVANGDFWDQKRRAEGGSVMSCDPWSRKSAESFVYGAGWAPTFIMAGGKFQSGVEAMASMDAGKEDRPEQETQQPK